MHERGINIKKYKLAKEAKKRSFFSELLNKDVFHKKINLKGKENFYLELFSMLQAGMDINDSIGIVLEQQQKQFEREIFLNIKEDLVSGYSLSECMKRSKQFTPYEYYCVQIGEESGRVKEVLEELATYFGNKIKIVRQIIKNISYPIVILSSSIIAMIFMITFIVPMFSSIFERFGGDLPVITKVFISIADIIKENILIVFLFITLLISILYFIWNKPKVKIWRHFIVIKIPVIGSMVRSIYLSRFCSAMALLTSAKVPLVTSINLVGKMIDYYPLKNALEIIENEIIKGNPFYKSISKFSLFDAKMVALLKVGEEVNKMDTFFLKLHRNYSDEIDMKANAINTFLEPIIIVFLGLVIGTMLIAMYLPMFKLSNSIV